MKRNNNYVTVKLNELTKSNDSLENYSQNNTITKYKKFKNSWSRESGPGRWTEGRTLPPHSARLSRVCFSTWLVIMRVYLLRDNSPGHALCWCCHIHGPVWTGLSPDFFKRQKGKINQGTLKNNICYLSKSQIVLYTYIFHITARKKLELINMSY